MNKKLSVSALAISSAIALAGCGSADTQAGAESATAASSSLAAASPSESMDHSETAKADGMVKGAFVDYKTYMADMKAHEGTKVVYFFHANWCPDCQATENSLKSAGVPDGLTVVKVDYDTMTDLKQKYGITQQHSFVEVDKDGKALKKWAGTKTGANIKKQLI